jgi:hypothetical protein
MSRSWHLEIQARLKLGLLETGRRVFRQRIFATLDVA